MRNQKLKNQKNLLYILVLNHSYLFPDFTATLNKHDIKY